MRLTLESAETGKSRLSSLGMVGLIQAVEGLPRTKRLILPSPK